jgi:ferredoxin
VSICPLDCILEHVPEGGAPDLPNQLFVNPDDCIDCGMCEPECPWEAIVDEESVPESFNEDIALNAITLERPDEFQVSDDVQRPPPTAE